MLEFPCLFCNTFNNARYHTCAIIAISMLPFDCGKENLFTNQYMPSMLLHSPPLHFELLPACMMLTPPRSLRTPIELQIS